MKTIESTHLDTLHSQAGFLYMQKAADCQITLAIIKPFARIKKRQIVVFLFINRVL